VAAASNVALLACRADAPVERSSLGDLHAYIRRSNGDFWWMSDGRFEQREAGRCWLSPLRNEVILGGWYEVRWYGTTASRRRYEIARSKYWLSHDVASEMWVIAPARGGVPQGSSRSE
jgi:hypothetical protein